MNFDANPVAVTELAIIARLRDGLGRLVRSVDSYAGELDEDAAIVIRSFPAAWVTFAGVDKTQPYGTSRRQHKVDAKFVVIVGERSIRNGAASRHGGPGAVEHGSYLLMTAVRRLLTQQDMGLPIEPLRPGRVRTLYNTKIEGLAVSAFACEFSTAWVEGALERDYWPNPQPPSTDPNAPPVENPDEGFWDQGGKTGPVDPDWLRTGLNYSLQPDDGNVDAQDIIDKE